MSNSNAKIFLVGLIAKYGDSLNGITKEEVQILTDLGADNRLCAHWVVETSPCGRFENSRQLSWDEPKTIKGKDFIHMKCYHVCEDALTIASYEKHENSVTYKWVGSKIIEGV